MAKRAGTDQDLLAMALLGCEARAAKINAAIAGIRARLGHRGPGRPRASGGAAPAKYTMSAAARKRIAAVQRKRWAAVKKSHGKSAAKPRPLWEWWHDCLPPDEPRLAEEGR